MKQTIFNICLWLSNVIIIIIIYFVLINKMINTQKKNSSCNNNNDKETFKPYNNDYNNGIDISMVKCADIKCSKSFTMSAPMTFHNTTSKDSEPTDTNKTIEITNTGDISVKNIDNFKVNGGTLLNALYPVGSIYISMNNTNPSKFIGGTWVQISNRFLYCTTSDAKGTGGSDNVKLTIDNLPSHKHSVNITTSSNGSHTHTVYHKWKNGSTWYKRYFKNKSQLCSDGCNFDDGDISFMRNTNKENETIADTAGAHTHVTKGDTGSTGSTKAFSIMPPYMKIYCWYRTK